MSPKNIKSPRSLYIVLGVGVVIGAAAAGAILRGPIVPKAFADPNPMRVVGNLSTENMAALRNMNESFANLSDYISPSVVAIQVESSRSSDMMGRRMPTEAGEGSGVIIRPDGWILTNDHVVGGFDKVTVVLNDGREFSGKVTRSDYSDLAVVKIEAKDLPTVSFADSNQVRPGQFAIAVGAPFGLENSVTIGHVSALGRQSSIGDPRQATGQRDYPDLIQTDAAINRGNSGGPLLDIEGKVIGINTAIFSATGGSVGVGFAIPANQARLTSEMLIEKGRIVRGFMGMAPSNVKPFRLKELGISGGAIIESFSADGTASPARDAGLKVGDVIVRIGDVQITGQHDVRNAMLIYGPGETATVEYMRGTDRKTTEVKLIDASKLLAKANRQNQPDRQMPDFSIPDLLPGDENSPEDNEFVPPVREGKARLGVQIGPMTDDARKKYNVSKDATGLMIFTVEEGSVAARNGMRPGDVVQKIGSVEIRSESDLRRAMDSVKWGDTVQVKFVRFQANGMMSRETPVTFR